MRRLIERARTELAVDFGEGRAIRVSRAPGRLDVMGGIAHYTGSMICQYPLARAAAVALTARDDRDVQVFSFNLYDEHRPFTLRISLDALAAATAESLRRDFAHEGRKWAGYFVGCLFVLHEKGRVDLRDPAARGINLAVLSTVPMGAGVSSSAAVEVATMMNLVGHFRELGSGQSPARSEDRMTPLLLAQLCQDAENRIVGAPCGIMDQVSSACGEDGKLIRMVCQPHEILPPVALPEGVRTIGIDTGVKRNVGDSAYARTRCAAFMAHRMILDKMRHMGAACGRELTGDPMHGYLANVKNDDYKNFFRPYLPQWMSGREFLDKFGGTIDTATTVEAAENYPVRHAADHHVLEARRVERFVSFLQEAVRSHHDPAKRGAALRRAGHLMYASHLSYTMDAFLGAEECDWIVEMVKDRESTGLYGAKITAAGSGGTVAILARQGEGPDAAIDEIVKEYEKKSGRHAEVFADSSPGAWEVGTEVF